MIIYYYDLSGLCRSCEIFGVSKYVIPTLNILNDQQFQNLSVSSHTWVDLVEVDYSNYGQFILLFYNISIDVTIYFISLFLGASQGFAFIYLNLQIKRVSNTRD